MDKDKLIRYIRGESNLEERREILSWIEGSDENARTYNSLKSEWVFQHLPNKEVSDNVVRKIRRCVRPKVGFREWVVRIAALLFIPVALFSLYQYFNNPNSLGTEVDYTSELRLIPSQKNPLMTYSVNSGVKGLVELPDGSKVWLNGNSTLKCPGEFDSTSRMVELSGEGYFVVVSNKRWPMYVRTKKDITVKVTGTEFNLSSYENDNELRFTLVSGNVTLIKEQTKQAYNVESMEELIIPDDRKLKIRKSVADVRLSTSWKDGFLVFENVPMCEVIKKMERWYGVTFMVEDPRILNYHFTADFKSESVVQVLELLKISSNIDYSIDRSKVKLFF